MRLPNQNLFACRISRDCKNQVFRISQGTDDFQNLRYESLVIADNDYSPSQRFPKRKRGKRGGKVRLGERERKEEETSATSHFKLAAVRGSVLTSAPLKATDVAAERWDSLKEKGDTCVLIDNLEEQGRNLEVRWLVAVIRNS